MKTFLLASFLVAVAAISNAEAQARQTFTAPTGDARTDRTERRTAPVRQRPAEAQSRARHAAGIPRR
jgi:DMSO/TMAO reductase YedYZ molybdopterin-dependent catalytic subunit